MIMISSNFIFNFTNFCVIVSFFLTKSLRFGILFSIAVRAVVVVAKLVMLGILRLRAEVVAKLVISGISYSIFLILALYTSFLTKFFFVHHLVCLNEQEQVLIYQHLICLLYFSNCLNYLVYFSISQYLIYLH